MKNALTIITLLTSLAGAQAQVLINAPSTNYTVTFDATLTGVSNGQFAGTGFQATPVAGQLDSDAWAFTGWSDGDLAFGGNRTTATTDYTRGNVSAAQGTGGIYSYGTTDRQLMIQPGGSDFAPGNMTLRVQNNTGSLLNSFTVSYELYVRNDAARSSSFNFSYSTDGTSFTNVSTGLFQYTSPTTADALGWRSLGTPQTTLSASVASGDFFFMRWSGARVSGTGIDDEFGLDDITVNAVPEPSALALLSLGCFTLLLLRRGRRHRLA